MVCQKCEKKLTKLAAPDPFKSSSSSIKDGSRMVGENKLLTGRTGTSKKRYQPYGGNCKDCKSTTQNKAKYCHGCAYKKGLCAQCGKTVLDTTGYIMSSK